MDSSDVIMKILKENFEKVHEKTEKVHSKGLKFQNHLRNYQVCSESFHPMISYIKFHPLPDSPSPHNITRAILYANLLILYSLTPNFRAVSDEEFNPLHDRDI